MNVFLFISASIVAFLALIQGYKAFIDTLDYYKQKYKNHPAKFPKAILSITACLVLLSLGLGDAAFITSTNSSSSLASSTLKGGIDTKIAKIFISPTSTYTVNSTQTISPTGTKQSTVTTLTGGNPISSPVPTSVPTPILSVQTPSPTPTRKPTPTPTSVPPSSRSIIENIQMACSSCTNLKITVLLNKVILDNSNEAHVNMTFTNISSETLDGVAYNDVPALGNVSTFGDNFTLLPGGSYTDQIDFFNVNISSGQKYVFLLHLQRRNDFTYDYNPVTLTWT